MPETASKRAVRIGVCGLGRAFTLMLPTFLQDERVRLVAACDPRAEARAQFERDFQGPAHADFETLVKDPQVEAVYISSPHQLHAEQTILAARHGKHVLVEKPMALSVADCDRMIDACETAGVHLIVGHCHSFDSPYLQARELIERGDAGAVKMITALNFTDFLYRPRRPEELDTAQGGGVVFSQAAHQVDVVRMLAGSPVSRVRATLGSWDPARPTEGAYAATLWFDSGAFATLTYSGYGHFDSDEWTGWTGEMGQAKSAAHHGAARRRLASVGDAEAEARLKSLATYGGPDYKAPLPTLVPTARHQHFGPVIVSCERADVRPMPDAVCVYADEWIVRHELPLPTVPRAEVIDELVDAVTGTRRPFHDGRWARGTLAVCLALLRSAREQAEVAP